MPGASDSGRLAPISTPRISSTRFMPHTAICRSLAQATHRDYLVQPVDSANDGSAFEMKSKVALWFSVRSVTSVLKMRSRPIPQRARRPRDLAPRIRNAWSDSSVSRPGKAAFSTQRARRSQRTTEFGKQSGMTFHWHLPEIRTSRWRRTAACNPKANNKL